MTSLANSLIVRTSSANLSTASIWAIKALNILEDAEKSKARLDMLENPLDVSEEDEETRKMCDRVKSVALFNLGVLASVRSPLLLLPLSLFRRAKVTHCLGWVGLGRWKASFRRLVPR